jgi:hypothetical protein
MDYFDLEDKLENWEQVLYRIKSEGMHYCFKNYSHFEEIEDDEFHDLRKKYLSISSELEKYVRDKVEYLKTELDFLEDPEESEE